MSIAVDIMLGCTASGKGRVAFHLARHLDAEIVSVDSMKVYRRMDIGTGKPSPDARRAIRHHLIDVVDPGEWFSVARYLESADRAIADVLRRGKRPLAAGGTALYIKALTQGLFEGPDADPEIRRRLRAEAATAGVAALHVRLASVDPAAAERIHPNDLRRIERALEVYELTGKPISALQQQEGRTRPGHVFRLIGLVRDREDQARRINKRAKRMIELGLIDEVRALTAADQPPLSKQAGQAVGYREIIDHLEGGLALDDAVERIKINTRRLAKGQRTWFKRFPNVHWVPVGPDDDPEAVADRILPIIAEPPRV